MSKLKRLAFPLLILCVSAIFIGCGVGKRHAEQSSSEMEDVRDVRIEAEADVLAFGPDGTTLASWSHGIHLWDANSGEKLGEVDDTGTEGGCCSIAFSPNGAMLATVHSKAGDSLGKRKTILYLWQVSADKQLGKPQVLLAKMFHARDCGSQIYDGSHIASFSGDGNALALATPDGTVHVWETATGEERVHFPGGVAASFAEDGKTLVSVTQGGIIRRWETETGKVVNVDLGAEPDGYMYVGRAAFDPSGTRVAMSDGYAICIKDTQTGRTLSRMESMRPKSLAFTAAGTLLVADVAGVQIVDADTGEARGRLWDHVDRDQALAFSRDGKCVALSNEKSILIHSWAKVAAQADQDVAPILGGGSGTALKAELVANTDTYDLDPGGKTAEQFSSLAWPDRAPPTVDLSFRLRNMGSQPVSVRVWDKEEVYGVYLLGEGAFNYSWCPQTGPPDVNEIKTVSLIPGESFSFPVTQLLTWSNKPYWLLPGEYTIHASASLNVSPPPPGVKPDEDGFGLVHFEAAPVKVKVRAGK